MLLVVLRNVISTIISLFFIPSFCSCHSLLFEKILSQLLGEDILRRRFFFEPFVEGFEVPKAVKDGRIDHEEAVQGCPQLALPDGASRGREVSGNGSSLALALG